MSWKVITHELEPVLQAGCRDLPQSPIDTEAVQQHERRSAADTDDSRHE
jgi:hypothetical protein